MQSPVYARSAPTAKWKKPLNFGLYSALGALLFAIFGEVFLALTAPPLPPPPPPPPPTPPQAVVLVLDTSGSMIGSSLSQMKEAAKAYVGRQNMTTSRLGVVHFDSESRIDSDLSRSGATLQNAIEALDVNGTTRMDLGLSAAISLLPVPPVTPVNQAGVAPTEQRSILLFTDGYPDSHSESGDPVANTLSAAQAARQNGIRIVAVGTDDADKNFLAQVTGDPKLVFGASDGQFGEAFKQAEIALSGSTGRALIQSEKVENFDAGLEMIRTSVWTGLLGLGIASALLLSQNFYARGRLGGRQLLGALAGLAAGLIAGALGQWMFLQAGNDSFSLALGRLLAWATGGALLGLGIAPFVPNLALLRAGLGGALGGWIGAMGFLLVARASGDFAGRILGAALIGFAIGLMVVLAEVAFRKAWLHVSYGPKDAFDLSLGAQMVAVGSDRSQCRIFARESLPVAARYGFEKNQAFLIDRNGGRRVLQAGDTRRFGNVEITLCSETVSTSPSGAPSVPEAMRPTPNPAASVEAPAIAAALPTALGHWILQGVQTLELPQVGSVTIGRVAGNDIVLSDQGVSSRHATLTNSGSSLSVCDHSSTNGTYLNGRRLTPETPTSLSSGDTLRLGRLDFRVLHN